MSGDGFGVISKSGGRLEVILAFGGWRPAMPLNYPAMFRQPYDKGPKCHGIEREKLLQKKTKCQLDKEIGSGSGMAAPVSAGAEIGEREEMRSRRATKLILHFPKAHLVQAYYIQGRGSLVSIP